MSGGDILLAIVAFLLAFSMNAAIGSSVAVSTGAGLFAAVIYLVLVVAE